MAIASGDRLGPYEILAPLGAGGMGEVYKARDPRLERTVAIKVLPEHLAEDPDRRERLEREAKAVSQLNHAHICTLHDVGSDNGIDYLVMEYLDGQTLADRLTRGPLPLDEAARYTRQIAEALDAAHRHGVVHRDLKPGNIMLTKAGVKLMDFGLAKVETSTAEADSVAPTAAKPLTQEGTVMGTVPYMAPEQLEGKTADARTDVFAYGAVVYEMVTGRRAFEGDSQASIIAAIMTGEPQRLRELQPLTPSMLEVVVSKSLSKSPDDRWQSMRDIGIVLDVELESTETMPTAPRKSWLWIAWAAALVLAVSATWLARRPSDIGVSRLVVTLPEAHEFRDDYIPSFDVSRDGRRIVFSSRSTTQSPTTLFVRELGEFETHVVEAAYNAMQLALSPDGRSVAFARFPGSGIHTIGLNEGIVEDVSDTGVLARGIRWVTPESLIYGAQNSGLWRVPASGGEPEPLTELGPSDTAHLLPAPLPRGSGVVFTVQRGFTSHIAVASGGSREYSVLFDGFGATYVSSGHLLFGRDGVDGIYAVAFNPDTLETMGSAVQIEAGALLLFNHPQFRVADDVLVYASGMRSAVSVVWVDREGRFETVQTSNTRYHTLNLSPDGTRFVADDTASSLQNIWVHDLERETRTLIESGLQLHIPRFSPDGAHIAYSAAPGNVYLRSADGTGEARTLLDKQHTQYPLSWSPAGDLLALTETHPDTGTDVWILPIDDEPYPFVRTDANESSAAFSRDGKWLAYQSDESGRPEIYVQPFPGPGERILVSTNGGKEPVWSRDGRELFYRQETALMAVSVDTDEGFDASRPELLFDGPFVADVGGHASYDVSLDGQAFLMIHTEMSGSVELRVVLNLADELEARVPR